MKLNQKHPAYIVLYAAVVSTVFTAAITTLHVATAGRVRQNEALDEAKALAELLLPPGEVAAMSDRQMIEAVDRRIASRQMPEAPFTLYTAYDWDKSDAKSKVTGRAFTIEGIGFWATIKGILALKPDLSEITGVVFLQHSETPGLGGRITEEDFREQFRDPDSRLLATPPQPGGKFIYVGGAMPTGPGDPRYRRRVDAISGATGTCTALETFLNDNLRRFRAAARAEGLIGVRPAQRRDVER